MKKNNITNYKRIRMRMKKKKKKINLRSTKRMKKNSPSKPIKKEGQGDLKKQIRRKNRIKMKMKKMQKKIEMKLNMIKIKKTININPFKNQERQDNQCQVVDQLKCLEGGQEKDLGAEKEECDLY